MAGGGRSRGGATSRRAVELRSALDEMRRKRELTSGSHIRPDKYLVMPRGLSAGLERTVRESGVTMRVLHLSSTRVLRSPLPMHRARICVGRFSVQAAPPRLSTKPRRRSTHRPRLPPLPAKAAAVASRRPARNGPAGRAHRSSRWPHAPSIRGGLALAARRAPRARGLCSLNAKAG